MHARQHQRVDRQFDHRQVGGEQGHPVKLASVQGVRQRSGKAGRVSGVEPVRNFSDVLVPKVAGQLRDLPLY